MAVTTTQTNKPFNPRGNDQSPLAYNRAKLFSGKALDFDGVNDSVFLSDFTLTGNTASISFYLNWDDLGTDVLQFICEGNDPLDLLIHTGGASGVNGFRFAMTSGATFDSTGVIQNGYNYYTFTTDGTTANVYVNGSLFNSETINLGSVNISELGIGNRQLNNTLFFDGQIAGFKIFNTALTAAQVADLYNNPEKVVPTGVDNTALKLWLPMQEGAGTTAYDGSGNGNHGTISGATYVNGVGAPVSQTAVIDWNKGTNEVLYSEDFSQSDWATSNMTKTTGQTDYLGGTNAVRVTCSSGVNAWFSQPTSGVAVGDVTIGAYIKGVSAGGTLSFSTAGSDRSDSRINYTTEWVYYEWTITETSSSPRVQIDNYSDGGGQEAIDVYFCFPRLVEGTNADVYVRTGATAQTSPVLLPQGLTSGRDITGVNLFENVRKQGALNLDGNSWAEVHDNASLDFGTGSFSLETWAKVKYLNQGSAVNAILTLGGDSASNEAIYINSSPSVKFEYNGDTTGTGTVTEGDWVHIVGTYDETNATLYINGSQNAQTARTAADITNELVKQIGRDSTTFRYYNDQIAQPRIYNRALTAEEVQRSYDSGKNIFTNS